MHESYKKWLEDSYPKVYCNCGCNKEIIIKEHHKRFGIPKYIHGHCPRSIETRKKISESNSGENCSIETRKKLSESNSGENHPLYGKHLPEKTKKKISEANSGEKHYNYGKNRSKETKIKISKSRIGKYNGENNPSWKGGITPLNKKIRTCDKYSE